MVFDTSEDPSAFAKGSYAVLHDAKGPNEILTSGREGSSIEIRYRHNGRSYQTRLTASNITELALQKSQGEITDVVLATEESEGMFFAWQQRHAQALLTGTLPYDRDRDLPLLAAGLALMGRESILQTSERYPALNGRILDLNARIAKLKGQYMHHRRAH